MEFDTEGLESLIPVEELEIRGIWLEFPGGRKLKVRRAGGSNKAYIRAVQKAVMPYRRRGLDSIPDDKDEAIMRWIYAEHIVVAWSGIRDMDGNEVECIPKNVKAFFDAVPELFSDLVKLTTEASLFSQQQLEEAAAALGED